MINFKIFKPITFFSTNICFYQPGAIINEYEKILLS